MNWRAILTMVSRSLERFLFGAARFAERDRARKDILLASGMVHGVKVILRRYEHAEGAAAELLGDVADAILDEVVDQFGDLGREVLRRNGITPKDDAS